MMQFSHINWELFHFLRPNVLYVLYAVMVIAIWSLLRVRSSYSWVNFFEDHLKTQLILKGNENLRWWYQLVLWFTLVLAIIGVAGPTWQTVEVAGKKLRNPVIIVLDVSQSMMSTDLSPNRLQRAKFKINDLFKLNPKAQFGLVVFAGSAHMVIPPTADFAIISAQLENITPSTMPVAGSNVKDAMDLAIKMCESSSAAGIITIFTDEVGQPLFNPAQELGTTSKTKLYVIPTLTESGAKIPKPNRGVYYANGKPVESKLDSTNLKMLQGLNNVSIVPFTVDNSDMQLLQKGINENLVFTTKSQFKEDEWIDSGWWLILPFMLVLLFLFRKGFVIFSFVWFSYGCNDNQSVKSLFQTPNYHAQQLENEGQYHEAAEIYQDPYRKGLAYLKAKMYSEALTQFAKDTSALAKYHMGVAYYRLGDVESASLAFTSAAKTDSSLQVAQQNADALSSWLSQNSPVVANSAAEEEQENTAQNMENRDMEDLAGGGQEATKEDMKVDRKEETVSTDIRTAKELDEVPPQFDNEQSNGQKVLMRKVNDDPALFLKRKFKMQQKNKPAPKSENPW